MKLELLDVLRCPISGAPLRLIDAVTEGDQVESGFLITDDQAHVYPIVRSIPRFVSADNYTSSFGLQWNRFRKTQLDSHSGVPVSRRRFYDYSGWSPGDLRGKRVLDVGCGAGRFTEIALEAGAEVFAVDYSSAVEACWENHRACPRVHVLQADLYHLPFAPEWFDFVYCFGVLQHTPDVRAAFHSLPLQLRPGGRLAVDLYHKRTANLFWSKYWVRPFTRRIAPETLFRLVQTWVPRLLPLSRALGRIPRIGRKVRHVIPLMSYDSVLPLTDAQLQEWAVLDTFDMLSARYDQPQTVETLRRWFAEEGLEERHVELAGFVVGRGRKPADNVMQVPARESAA